MFIVGSVAGAASSSGGEVILARVLQGMASGLIQPVAMVVMSQVFPREQRGRAMGIYGIGIVLAPALGPTLGGFLVDEYSWRDVFLAIVPVCLVAMAAAAVFLPGRDTRQESRASRFDGFGFLFLVVFLVCLLSALSNGQREGWNSDLILALFAAALASAVAFVAWELTLPDAAAEPARVRQWRVLGQLPGRLCPGGGHLWLHLYRSAVRADSCRATRRPVPACC